MTYRNIRDYLVELDRRGLLVTVNETVNKDTEIGSLVRWQFRGLPEEHRKGWWFTDVTDSRGRAFDGSVAMAIAAASPQVYAAALGLEGPEQIPTAWVQAQANPLEPVVVSRDEAPVKEVILTGDQIRESGGLDQFPVPILIPGYDVAAYFTCPVWITKDPENGDVNAGIYRVQVKGADRAGVCVLPTNHGTAHWRSARARGEHLEAALCLSPIPSLGLAAATKLPPGTEYGVAGALNGAPLEVVPCETVDLMVPAEAEIVVEGRFRTDLLEIEGPFGEFAGFVGESMYSFIFEVTAITHRRSPVLQAFISEMPPSESSVMRRIGWEAQLLRELRAKVPSVREVRFYEEGGAAEILAISLHQPRRDEVAQALHMGAAFHPTRGKWVIAVDDDIDITDLSSVMWALAWRVQPHRDTEMQRGMVTSADPSAVPPDAGAFEKTFPDGKGGSRLLIDATLKWGYTPVSLPAREHMEHARQVWDRLGLPPLHPQGPWHGYDLGHWSEEHQQAARLATDGRYLETGAAYARDRIDAVYLDTGQVIPVDPEPDGIGDD